MGSFEEILYKYDETERISEKLFPEEMRTRWFYKERGQLAELIHEDRHGVLDKYQYEYDSMGNKTVITKDRRGLKEESRRYEYGYNAFGDRSSMEDHKGGRNISYTYDALNRLISAKKGSIDAVMQGNTVHMDYSYDNRGNMVREETEGKLIHGYEYGAMNRLAKAWMIKDRRRYTSTMGWGRG